MDDPGQVEDRDRIRKVDLVVAVVVQEPEVHEVVGLAGAARAVTSGL